MESWPSGLWRNIGNVVIAKAVREFESHRLRQINAHMGELVDPLASEAGE